MLIGEQPTELHRTGAPAGAGSFLCVECSCVISLAPSDAMPVCPGCGGKSFRKASLFEQPTLDSPLVEPRDEAPDWLEGVRAEVDTDCQCVAFVEDGETRVVRLEGSWSRIGRTASADIRLDHPTVSRRHALIVRADDGGLRILDDRSLNGVYVNGKQVDWSPLEDGDELEIGSYRVYVIDNARVAAST